TGGPAWRQTIFWPFADFSNLGRGRVLRTYVDVPTYATRYYDPTRIEELYDKIDAVPYLKLSAVHSEADRMVTLFMLNRHLSDAMEVSVEATGFGQLTKARGTELRHKDLLAVNSKDKPDEV